MIIQVDEMGVKDCSAKVFFENTSQAADLINLCFFEGERIFNGSDLEPFNPEQYRLERDGIGDLVGDNRERDMIFLSNKLTDGTTGKMLIGFEFQSKYDTSMLARMNVYNARQYQMQYDTNMKATFGKLLPVASILVNLSLRRWGGARSLYQAFNGNKKRVCQVLIILY